MSCNQIGLLMYKRIFYFWQHCTVEVVALVGGETPTRHVILGHLNRLINVNSRCNAAV